MTSENIQNDRNNPQPFFIWKNARKEIKKQQRRRKQSYQYPATEKKQRKMTIEVSRQVLELEDLPSFKSLSQDRAIEQEHDSLQCNAFNDSISQQEDDYVNESIGKTHQQQDSQQQKDKGRSHRQHSHENVNNQHRQHEEQIEDNIPFACDEWELDRESPFLKTLNTMYNQMDQLRLDI